MFTTMCVNIYVEFMTKDSPTYYIIFSISFVSHVFEIPINDPFYTEAKGRHYYISSGELGGGRGGWSPPTFESGGLCPLTV